MNEKPYFNEPGFEVARDPRDVSNYNACLRHETMRVAVCEMLSGPAHESMPEPLRLIVRDLFSDFYERYRQLCLEEQARDGEALFDPFDVLEARAGHTRLFQYTHILKRLEEIKHKLETSSGEDNDSGGGHVAQS